MSVSASGSLGCGGSGFLGGGFLAFAATAAFCSLSIRFCTSFFFPTCRVSLAASTVNAMCVSVHAFSAPFLKTFVLKTIFNSNFNFIQKMSVSDSHCDICRSPGNYFRQTDVWK